MLHKNEKTNAAVLRPGGTLNQFAHLPALTSRPPDRDAVMPNGIKIERFINNSLEGGNTYAGQGTVSVERNNATLNLLSGTALVLESKGKQPAALHDILGMVLQFMSLQDGLLIASAGSDWQVQASRGRAHPVGTHVTDPTLMQTIHDTSGLPRIHQRSQNTQRGFDILIPLRFELRTTGMLVLTSTEDKALPDLERIASLRTLGAMLAAALSASPESGLSTAKANASPPNNLLTARELQVLAWLPHGLTNIAIGEKLNIAPGTVKSHVERILHKLGLADRTQAAVYATRRGLDAT